VWLRRDGCREGQPHSCFCGLAFPFYFLSICSKSSIVVVFFPLVPNVRRYVQLAQSRGGACFCTRGAMQDYDVVLFIVALAKTVTPLGGPRREPGQAAPPTTQLSSLARRFSRCGKANCIYRPVVCSFYLLKPAKISVKLFLCISN
jgi:hypothetical protein